VRLADVEDLQGLSLVEAALELGRTDLFDGLAVLAPPGSAKGRAVLELADKGPRSGQKTLACPSNRKMDP
jgi:hypothetical protein